MQRLLLGLAIDGSCPRCSHSLCVPYCLNPERPEALRSSIADCAQVEFLKQTGAFDRSYFKRRDEFVEYVEKAIKLHHNLGHRDGVGGAAGGGNGKK